MRCLLSPGSVDPYNPKVVRSSMGAVFHVPLETEVGLDSLASRYPHIGCLDLGGEAISTPGFGIMIATSSATRLVEYPPTR